jgi:glycerophosphoryl diester phosphodiesterase
VDVFIGNHFWQNNTEGKLAAMSSSKVNPFINPDEWVPFLRRLEATLKKNVEEESRTEFVTFAHRGASEYCPENTMMSFYMGMQMGANGIETDVQRTKDGVLVLFHDDTIKRVTGEEGSIRDYTYEELCAFTVKKGELHDKIPTFEDFLSHFAYRDITFAIELKMGGDGIEEAVAELIRKYGADKKTTVTSFCYDFIKNMRACAPDFKIGYLTRDVSEETINKLLAINADEICPIGSAITEEDVKRWHRIGFNVRAWGISNTEIMKKVYDCGADGMTVNFPDKLLSYIKENAKQEEDQ